MRRNFAPASQQFNERGITREYKTFKGMYEDIPNIPQGAMRLLDNYVAFNDRLEPRNGTRKWSTVQRPKLRSGITLTKSATPEPSGTYVGKYKITWSSYSTAADGYEGYTGTFVKWPDGSFEEVVGDDSQYLYVVESTAHANTTAGEIWAPFCGWFYHQGRKRIVFQFGHDFYVADEAMTFINRAYSRTGEWSTLTSSAVGAKPAMEKSSFFAMGDSVVAVNRNGIFSIDLNRYNNEAPDIIGTAYAANATNFYTYSQLNTPPPSNKITAIARSTAKPYGYRYFYTMTELYNPGGLASTASDKWNRTVPGVRIVRESAPIDNSRNGDLIDYSEIWTAKPVGDNTINYATWVRTAALPAAFDTLAELKLISDGQFKVTIDGVQKNIKCDLTGATTYDEVADKMTSALSAQFSDCYVEYNRTYSTFTIVNPAAGGRITLIEAGDAGTADFYLMFRSATVPFTPSTEGQEALVAKYEEPTIAGLSVPTQNLGNVRYCDNYTHFSLYRTLDIGVNGIDPVTGQGNNKELFIWVKDIPITRKTVYTGTIEAKSGTGSSGQPYNAEIVITGTDTFAYTIGFNIFDATGIYFGRIHGLSGTQKAYVLMNVVPPGTYPLAFTFGFNKSDETWAAQSDSDELPDDSLRSRIADFSVKNRLWKALPRYRPALENKYDPRLDYTDSLYQGIGCFGLGFMLSSYKDQNLIYYSQVPNGYEYLAGYGNQARQVIRLEDAIQYMVFLIDTAVVFCRHSIWQIPLNNYSDVMYEDLGLSTAVLSSQQEISREIGCLDWGSIKQVGATGIIFKASDGSIRTLQYSGGGITLSDSISKDQVQNRIMALSGISAACFDTRNGYLLWGKEETTNTLDQSFRFATDPTNGIGWALNSGSAWITPEIGCESITVFDAYGRHSTLILDIDGYVYDISGQLSSSTGITRIRKDKAAVAGTGGTAIQTKVKLPEDTGTFEHFWQTHEESHVYFRPIDEALRRTSGYDSAGFPTTMEVDLTLYKDGEPTNYSAQAKDIQRTGDIFFDRIIRAHRLQLEIEVNNGEHIIVGTQQYYKSADQPSENSTLVSTEQEHQLALAAASARLGFSGVTVVNLQNGADAAATGLTATTDPTGISGKALLTSSADAVLASGDLSADFSVMIAVQTVENNDIIVTDNNSTTIKFTESAGVYSVVYIDGNNLVPITLSWTGAGWLFLAVVRDGSTLKVYEAY